MCFLSTIFGNLEFETGSNIFWEVGSTPALRHETSGKLVCNAYAVCMRTFPAAPVYLCICVSVYLCICVSVYLCICVSVYLSICLSVYLSICVSVCFFEFPVDLYAFLVGLPLPKIWYSF